MKKNIKFIVLSCMLILGAACNEPWEEEVFTNYVGLKSPLNSSGVTNIYLPYEKDGKYIYQLPVVVAGSQMLGKNLEVNIVEYPDTLDILNEARYNERDDLYYKLLPKDYYEFPSSYCHIPADSCVGLFDIQFDFTGLDLRYNWVLPLRVAESDSYTPNPRKHFSKALLRIMPYNDYSGTYSGTDTRIFIEDFNSNPISLASRTFYVVDEKSVFLYAGDISVNLKDREKYKIKLTFEDDGNLTVKQFDENNQIEFQLYKDHQPTYERRVEKDATRPHIERHYTTVRFNYSYNDITTYGEQNPIKYRVECVMLMQRTIDTLKPERDQIQW